MHKAQLLRLNPPGTPLLLWARTTLAPPDQRKPEGNTECMEETYGKGEDPEPARVRLPGCRLQTETPRFTHTHARTRTPAKGL